MELQWPLIIFTTLLAWSAGVFGTQALLAFGGHAKKSQMLCWVIGAFLLIVGGIAVVFHLQHWERIFNGFGNPTSGITQELVMIVIVAIAAIIYLILMRRSSEGRIPKWISVVVILACLVLVIVMAHSYMMASRPVWDSVFWVLYVIGNACAIGPLTVGIVMAVRGDELSPIALPAIIGTVIGLVFAVAFAVFFQTASGSFTDVGYYFDPTNPTGGMTDVSATIGNQAGLIWGAAVVVGAVVPVICAIVARIKTGSGIWKALGAIGVICVIIGMLCMRIAFYDAGLSVFMYY